MELKTSSGKEKCLTPILMNRFVCFKGRFTTIDPAKGRDRALLSTLGLDFDSDESVRLLQRSVYDLCLSANWRNRALTRMGDTTGQ